MPNNKESKQKLNIQRLRCQNCGTDKLQVIQVNGQLYVVCGSFKDDGTGCQTVMSELNLSFKPEAKNEP